MRFPEESVSPSVRNWNSAMMAMRLKAED